MHSGLFSTTTSTTLLPLRSIFNYYIDDPLDTNGGKKFVDTSPSEGCFTDFYEKTFDFCENRMPYGGGGGFAPGMMPPMMPREIRRLWTRAAESGKVGNAIEADEGGVRRNLLSSYFKLKDTEEPVDDRSTL